MAQWSGAGRHHVEALKRRTGWKQDEMENKRSAVVRWGLTFGLIMALRPNGSTVRTRLSDFVTTASTAKKNDPLASRIFTGTEQSLEQTRWWQAFKEVLNLAEVKIPPVQLVVGTLVLTLFVAWFMATFVAGILALVLVSRSKT